MIRLFSALAERRVARTILLGARPFWLQGDDEILPATSFGSIEDDWNRVGQDLTTALERFRRELEQSDR